MREFWLNLTTKNPYGSCNAYTCWDKSLDTTGGEAIHLREVTKESEKELEELRKLLLEVKELTDYICNSSPQQPIKGKIESIALMIGHHPLVLNVVQRSE